MIRGVHTMFYSSDPEGFRAFVREKLQFPFTDVGEGWLIFDLPEARERLLAQHEAIVVAILAADPAAARVAAEAHIDYVAKAAAEALLTQERQQVANLRKIKRQSAGTRGAASDNKETKGIKC